MDHFAGLDVSIKETSICIVDDAGKIVREVKVASEPEALLAVLNNLAYHFKRIGLEAGPLSQWLFSALAEAGLPLICVETRHMQAVLKAQINKTDRNDARGIAQMMRVGLYRPVHVKTIRSQKLRMLLTHRKLLQSKAIAIENDLRVTLRNFGLKVGMVGKVKFEARIRELVENLPDLAVLVEPMLIVRRTLREQIVILHRRLLAIVRDDEVCRRLMTTPGVGPVVALTYRATVDVPARFRKSKAVGAVFGLTCAKYQSGEVDRNGRISRCGDEMGGASSVPVTKRKRRHYGRHQTIRSWHGCRPGHDALLAQGLWTDIDPGSGKGHKASPWKPLQRVRRQAGPLRGGAQTLRNDGEPGANQAAVESGPLSCDRRISQDADNANERAEPAARLSPHQYVARASERAGRGPSYHRGANRRNRRGHLRRTAARAGRRSSRCCRRRTGPCPLLSRRRQGHHYLAQGVRRRVGIARHRQDCDEQVAISGRQTGWRKQTRSSQLTSSTRSSRLIAGGIRKFLRDVGVAAN